MHARQHFVRAHVDKSLKTKLSLKKRTVQIVKGDTVKVMAGSKRGTTGKVMNVNLKTGRIFIDSLMKKNARGKEFNVPVSSSSVYITDLNLSDKKRAERLKLKYDEKLAQKVKEENKKEKEQKEMAAEKAADANAVQQEKPKSVQPAKFEQDANR